MTAYHVVTQTYSTPPYMWRCDIVPAGSVAVFRGGNLPPARCSCGAELHFENGKPVGEAKPEKVS